MTCVAIMQPYFFPYIGYFQLMRECDIFVALDDVQYIKGGWINRNRILLQGLPHWLTFAVRKDTLQLLINQRAYVDDDRRRSSLVATIDNAYRKAPRFEKIMPIVESVLAHPNANVADFNVNLLTELHSSLGLSCQIVASSALDKNPEAKGVERVLDICRNLGATRYVNAVGGLGLYDPGTFTQQGLELRFVRPRPVTYPQFDNPFVPFLSILDVLMFNNAAEVSALLAAYDLV